MISLGSEKNVPHHLAIVPDGNRRWAKAHRFDPTKGHAEGVKRFREIRDQAFNAGVSYFTFWGGSYDNLTKRGRTEVRVLVSLFREELLQERKSKRFIKEETRVRFFGEWREIINDKKLAKMADEIEKESSSFTKRNLTILFGYDGRREMVEAINKIKAEDGKGELDYEAIKRFLSTGDLPPVDFVIRTGGEPHWSAGFMMWLTSDSQFYFTKEFWPDFKEKEFKKALEEFSERERRFGV